VERVFKVNCDIPSKHLNVKLQLTDVRRPGQDCLPPLMIIRTMADVDELQLRMLLTYSDP